MEERDFIPLSALQHYLYCPRQCALIHVEQQWAENRQTAEGRVLHERVDSPKTRRRPGVRYVTAMPLADSVLGIAGVADLVEFHAGEGAVKEIPFPVEFKRGRTKAHCADEVQLCAQALCLETLFKVTVPAGALFYGQTRRRHEVPFDEALRRLTHETIDAVRAMLIANKTPPAHYESRRCDSCSLIDICHPRLLSRTDAVQAWITRHLHEEA